MFKSGPPPYIIDYKELISLIQKDVSLESIDSFLFVRVWSGIKKRINEIFDKTSYTYFSKLESYPDICFHLNPRTGCSYVPINNEIHLNIPYFLFLEDPKEMNKVFFNFEIIQARNILHELDHYLYHKNTETIGLTEKETIKFQKEHMESMELRAYKKTNDFLIECQKYLSTKITIDFLSKGKKGKFMVGYTEFDLTNILEQMIINHNENIELIEKDGISSYKADGVINSIENTNTICSFLNINTKLSDTEVGYYYIKIKY